MNDKYTDENILIQDINNELKEYEGYVQFSHRSLITSDTFINTDVKIKKEENGFIFEAHFCDGKESVTIRKINNIWFVDIQNIAKAELNLYHGKFKKVKMAQIWEEKSDGISNEEFKELQLTKVVFAGFKGGKHDNSTI